MHKNLETYLIYKNSFSIIIKSKRNRLSTEINILLSSGGIINKRLKETNSKELLMKDNSTNYKTLIH